MKRQKAQPFLTTPIVARYCELSEASVSQAEAPMTLALTGAAVNTSGVNFAYCSCSEAFLIYIADCVSNQSLLVFKWRL